MKEKIEVFFEYNGTADLVAEFYDDELYAKCVPALEQAAKEANAHLSESLTYIEDPELTIKAPDWELLREQKNTLLELCELTQLKLTDYTSLEGLIGLLDSIQDSAVESGDWTEEEIFNLKED